MTNGGRLTVLAQDRDRLRRELDMTKKERDEAKRQLLELQTAVQAVIKLARPPCR